MSIDYENNLHKLFPSKYNLKDTYKGFSPTKTFSKGIHHNNKILKMKNRMTKIYSNPHKEKYKNKTLSTPEQTNPISNNNTCYKTNGFSPRSTRSVFNPAKTLKEKNIRKKVPKNKKELLSMKYIGFIKDHNMNNHNYLKLIKKTKENENNNIIQDNHKEFNKENLKYIFVGDNELYKNNKKKKIPHKTNSLINKIESNCKIQKTLCSFSCPDIKLNKKKNENNKTKKDKKNFEIHNLFFESSKKENEEILNNINQIWSHTISTFGNSKKNKGLLFFLKNEQKKEKIIKHEKNIKEMDFIKKRNKNKSIESFLKNKKDYDLKADIEMFDPVTFIKNSRLYKDYLERKQREKMYLKKLIKKKNFEELFLKLNKYNKNENNKEENKALKINNFSNKSSDIINSDLEEEILNSYNKEAYLSYLNKNKLIQNKVIIPNEEEENENEENNNHYKTYLKPSEYVNEIANKILEDIGFFRKKVYLGEKSSNEKNKKFLTFEERKKLIKKKKQLISLKTNYSNNFLFKILYNSNNEKENEKNDEQNNHKEEIEHSIQQDENQNQNMIINNKKEKSIRIGRNDERNLSKKYSKEKFRTTDSDESKLIEKNKQRNVKKNKSERIMKEENQRKLSKNNYEKQNQKFTNEDNQLKDSKNISKYKNIQNNLLLKERKIKQNNYGQIKNLKNIYNKKQNEGKKENKFNINKYDELYGFNENDIEYDLVIVEELKKIEINDDLKSKLLENRDIIMSIINKKQKSKEDYEQLHFCRKRIQHIIKKLIEIMQKENLTSKGKTNSFLPKNSKDRKILYRYLRYLEIKIKRQLQKDNQLELSLSSSDYESEDENSNISGINFFSLLPIESEDNNKLKLEEKNKKKNKHKLIFDNLYLYKNKEGNNKKVEIKQEIYDILNENQYEEKNEEKEEVMPSGPPNIRPRRGKFTVRRKKFTKKNTKYDLKKIEDEKSEVIVEEEDNDEEKKLEKRIAKFYDKIKKLKRGEIELSDYEEELSELMLEQIDKVNYEGDKIKELRIFNFFRNFQMNRKSEILGKNFFRKKLVFNSPVKFTFYPKKTKIKSTNSMSK